jgi:hypothetical protein
MTTATLARRLDAIEAQRAARGAHYCRPLEHWTDEQLEAALLMLEGLPEDTRLTDEQLRAIMEREP